MDSLPRDLRGALDDTQRAEPSELRRELVCQVCYSFAAGGQKLKYCGRCKTAAYCSKQCAAADWAEHRLVCASMREAAESVLAVHRARGRGRPGEDRDVTDEMHDRVAWFSAIPGLRNEIQLLAWKYRHQVPVIYVIANLSGEVRIKVIPRSVWEKDNGSSIFSSMFTASFREQLRQSFDMSSYSQDKEYVTTFTKEDPHGEQLAITTIAGGCYEPGNRIVRGIEIAEALTTAVRAADLADAFAWFEVMFGGVLDILEWIRLRTKTVHGTTPLPGTIPTPTRSLNNEVAFTILQRGLSIEFDVRLEGLVGAAHLNGRECVIRDQDAKNYLRWRALLDDGSYVSVKAANFVHVRRGDYRRRAPGVD